MIPWIPFDSTFRELTAKLGNIVGVQVRVDGSEYLVGDVNELGGMCDDCRAFDRDDRVTAYRVLVVLPCD